MSSTRLLVGSSDQQEAQFHYKWFCEQPNCGRVLLCRRRHHCRSCGRSVCAIHSAENVTLPSNVCAGLVNFRWCCTLCCEKSIASGASRNGRAYAPPVNTASVVHNPFISDSGDRESQDQVLTAQGPQQGQVSSAAVSSVLLSFAEDLATLNICTDGGNHLHLGQHHATASGATASAMELRRDEVAQAAPMTAAPSSSLSQELFITQNVLKNEILKIRSGITRTLLLKDEEIAAKSSDTHRLQSLVVAMEEELQNLRRAVKQQQIFATAVTATEGNKSTISTATVVDSEAGGLGVRGAGAGGIRGDVAHNAHYESTSPELSRPRPVSATVRFEAVYSNDDSSSSSTANNSSSAHSSGGTDGRDSSRRGGHSGNMGHAPLRPHRPHGPARDYSVENFGDITAYGEDAVAEVLTQEQQQQLQQQQQQRQLGDRKQTAEVGFGDVYASHSVIEFNSDDLRYDAVADGDAAELAAAIAGDADGRLLDQQLRASEIGMQQRQGGQGQVQGQGGQGNVVRSRPLSAKVDFNDVYSFKSSGYFDAADITEVTEDEEDEGVTHDVTHDGHTGKMLGTGGSRIDGTHNEMLQLRPGPGLAKNWTHGHVPPPHTHAAPTSVVDPIARKYCTELTDIAPKVGQSSSSPGIGGESGGGGGDHSPIIYQATPPHKKSTASGAVGTNDGSYIAISGSTSPIVYASTPPHKSSSTGSTT